MKRQQNEPGPKSGAAPSHLAANAQRILEYADGGLVAADTFLIEEHLGSCPECQAFYQSVRRLNATLEQGVKCAGLSPSFTTRLWQRIDCSAESEATCLQQKQRMQMEFEQYSARLRKQFFGLPNLLDVISYSSALLVGCYLLFTGFRSFLGVLGELSPSFQQQRWLVLSGIVAIASIAVGLGLLVKDQAGTSAEEG